MARKLHYFAPSGCGGKTSASVRAPWVSDNNNANVPKEKPVTGRSARALGAWAVRLNGGAFPGHRPYGQGRNARYGAYLGG